MESEQKLPHEEFVKMLDLIRRYANDHMDQWELWQLDTKWGKVYIDISNAPTGPEDTYTDLTHLIVQK